MDGRKRIAGRIIDMVLLAAAIYICGRLHPESYYDAVGFAAADGARIFTDLRLTWACFALVCLWVLITAIAAYRKGMYFLRHDVKSQKTHDLRAEALWANTQRALYEGSGKGGKIMTISVTGGLVLGIILTIILIIWGVGSDFGQRTEVNQTCTDASQYNEWGSIPELEEYEEVPFDGTVYQIIFPDEIDQSQAEAYYSNVTGKAGEGWSSLTSVRYLKISYSGEEYAAEKQRISDLKVTADHEDEKGESFYGTSQSMILDTQHFPYETYIAVWDQNLTEYEYAMFDDAENTVYYVYAWDTELDQIMADDPLFEGNTAQVITEEEQNVGKGCYCIYAFDYRNNSRSLVEP